VNVTREFLHHILDPKLSANERARIRRKYAKQFEEAGNYDRAREAMGELWQGVGERPAWQGLDEEVKGEVLLRAGALTGWIGSTEQIEGAQEEAKNLISESIAIFEALNDIKRLADAQSELAVCYWRQGAIDDARVWLAEALSRTDDRDVDLRAIALLRSAAVEKVADRLNDALNILKTAAPLFERSSDEAVKGRFHNEFANVLRRLGTTQKRTDYIDSALLEYDAASFYFGEAGHARYQACVENNLALFYLELNKRAEAHEHLVRVQALFTDFGDAVHLAQVHETWARFFLAEGDLKNAEKSAQLAVQMLEEGGEQSLLAEALTTYGITLARSHQEEQARAVFERAIEVAERVDDLESASLAGLTLVEQLPESRAEDELFTILERADNRLENTQNEDLLRRRKNCFRRLGHRILWRDWPTSLRKSVRQHEACQILRALKESGGNMAQAARSLKLSAQGLQKILNTRQRNLLKPLEEIRAGQRVTSFADRLAGALRLGEGSGDRTVRILHIEDNEMVAGMVKETLEIQGWQVDTYANGSAALEKIASDADYDLLLLDYDLPGVNGIELVHRARELAHRSRTPIIVLSANPVEAAALKAGADEFLPKPQGISALVETITRLLEAPDQEHQES
jgi:CheY-like chemotaxis protein